MSINKHAIIRYHALDRCFGDHRRYYDIERLIRACNDAIYENTGINDSVKRRQVYYDIKFMESEQGWSIELEKFREDGRVHYRYKDANFSINKKPINENEAAQLEEVMTVLSRFRGMPQFDWMEEMSIRLRENFGFRDKPDESYVSFQQNLYLKGMEYFSPLFDAIRNKVVLMVRYQSFRSEESMELIIHPYYLKQYSNRWFLFGWNSDLGKLSNLALDRIQFIKPTEMEYRQNEDIDFEEYFEDVVGVTVNENAATECILIEVDSELWPYIESKPIHGSQKVKQRSDEKTTIELSLKINYELISLLFSYGDGLKVLSPLCLQQTLVEKAKKCWKNIYSVHDGCTNR